MYIVRLLELNFLEMISMLIVMTSCFADTVNMMPLHCLLELLSMPVDNLLMGKRAVGDDIGFDIGFDVKT